MPRWSSVGMAGVAVSLALVPLFGDARQSPVTHTEWARMLVRALGMQEVARTTTRASRMFSVLSWRESLTFDAVDSSRTDGLEEVERPAGRGLGGAVAGVPGLAEYEIPVLKKGDYKVRVEIAGSSDAPSALQLFREDQAAPVAEFAVIPSAVLGWLDAGSTHLDPGVHKLDLLIPAGTFVRRVEVVPPCVTPVEPEGGWRPAVILNTADLAKTTLQAVGMEWQLPPADTPIEAHGADFQPVMGEPLLAAQRDLGEGTWISAGPSGLQAMVFVDLPDSGLYTVSVFGIEGGGMSWLADACGKAVLCGAEDVAAGAVAPEWKVLMTREFEVGRHFFTVILGNGAAIGRLRFERKKTTGEDYIETLRSVGFDPGPPGPVSREKAIDTMHWIENTRILVEAENCGDIVTAATTVAEGSGTSLSAEPAPPVAGPGVAPPGVGQPPPAIGGPPVLPPQDVASPVVP